MKQNTFDDAMKEDEAAAFSEEEVAEARRKREDFLKELEALEKRERREKEKVEEIIRGGRRG